MDDAKRAKRQLRQYIIGIIVVLYITIFVVPLFTFLGPTIDDVPYVYPDCACYSMSKDDYKEIKKEINNLIEGGSPNSNSLIHILLTEGPERYYGVYFQSLAAQEETCGVCDDHTKKVYPLLQTAYEYALDGQSAVARGYLNQAEHLWKSPNP